MRTSDPIPKVGFEGVLDAHGYKLREIVQIADRQIKVYEKPQNPKYIPSTEQASNSLQRRLNSIFEVLNRNLILEDGFDKDHNARKRWQEMLEGEVLAAYANLDEQSKLNFNRISDFFSLLINIGDDIKDQALSLRFDDFFNNLSDFVKSKNYHNLALGDKVAYMEEVDKFIMQIVDFLRTIKADIQ